MKISGMIIIFFSIFGIGIIRSENENKAYLEEKDFYGFLKYAKNQIYFFSTETNTVFKGYEPLTDSFFTILNNLAEHGINKELFDGLSVNEKRKSEIKNFFEKFGLSNKSETLMYLEYYEKIQSDYIKQLKEKTENSVKSKKLTAFCLGILAVILLI